MRTSRWRSYAAVALAVASFPALFCFPLAVSLVFAQLLGAVWGVAPATALRWGWLWTAAFSVCLGLCVNGALFFVVHCAQLLPRWPRTRVAHPQPSGVVLNAGEAPELFLRMEAARRAVGLSHETELWVDLSVDLRTVTYVPVRSLVRRPAIVIGLPALSALTVETAETLLRFHCAFLTVPGGLLRAVERTGSLAAAISKGNERMAYFGLCGIFCNKAVQSVNQYAVAKAGSNCDAALQEWRKIAAQFQEYQAAHFQMLAQIGHLAPVAEGFREYRQARAADGGPFTDGLLRGAGALEGRLMALLAHANPQMHSISWGQAAPVLLENWAKQVEQRKDRLHGLTAGAIYELMESASSGFGRKAFHEPGRLYDPFQLKLMSAQLLGMALATALLRSGWMFAYSGPATALAFEKGGKAIQTFALLGEMLNRTIDGARWCGICLDCGIVDLPLG